MNDLDLQKILDHIDTRIYSSVEIATEKYVNGKITALARTTKDHIEKFDSYVAKIYKTKRTLKINLKLNVHSQMNGEVQLLHR